MMLLTILWHMHQPYYMDAEKNEIAGSTMIFRSLFNYYPMALLISRHPEVKATFNLTPVLLKQIDGICSGKINDRFLGTLEKDEVKREELLLLLQELPEFALKRFQPALALKEKLISNNFSSQDIFDLKIYMHLASFHPMIFDNELEEFIKKGRGFGVEDQERLHGKILSTMKKILPLYKTLQDKGHIEISTSPLMHPIMPLLFNTDNARKTKTSLHIPEGIFSFPEDASLQLKEGVRLYKKTFGANPAGIWPSEGSLSDEVLELFEKTGISWTATDEYVLSETLGRPLYGEQYSIWDFRGKVSVFFRDHEISDLIGFSYQQMEEKTAARDLIEKLEAKGRNSERKTLSIILDGENPWDFYDKYGQEFLDSFYTLLGKSTVIKSATFSQAVSGDTEHKDLQSISPGSWMGNNFDNWIGREPANKAWRILSAARAKAGDSFNSLSEEKRKQLEETIMVAESSDWFWWYSLPASTEIKMRFDSYFRNSVKRIYEISGLEVPGSLSFPVEEYEHEEAIPYITPIIDGKETHFYEWYNAVEIEPLNLWGTFKPADFPVKKVFYGYDEKNIYIRLDMNGKEKPELEIVFHNSMEKKFQITGEESKNGPLSFKSESITEIKIPRKEIVKENEKKLYFKIIVKKNGQSFKMPSLDYFKINLKEEEYWIV